MEMGKTLKLFFMISSITCLIWRVGLKLKWKSWYISDMIRRYFEPGWTVDDHPIKKLARGVKW